MARIRQLVPRIILVSGLLVVLAIYSMAWSGTLHFDDEPNLNGLYGISDWPSALRFVFSGESGPTGRPLSLATFALQHEAWPDPEPFLIFNTALHLVNAILCFLLVWRLLRLRLSDDRTAEWLAVAVALLWATSPFLAGGNLMVVQRMTGLSAFFVLLSLVAYLQFRPRYSPESSRGNLLLVSIVAGGTLMAGLSKENGFLLPLFILLIEWLVVPNAPGRLQRLARPLFLVVVVVPVLAIISYLGMRAVTASGYAMRDFTLLERLVSQARALMSYIRHLLIPVESGMTPFHDDFEASTGLLEPPSTLVSLVAVAALMTVAWRIRRFSPFIAFGLFWFLGGHLIESTVLGLELYFPHRNYLPAVGLYLAVIYAFYLLRQHSSITNWIPAAAVGGIVLSFFGVLAMGASLWGNRALAPEIWFFQKPESVRAGLYLYSHYAGQGNADVADRFNERLVEIHRGNALLSTQALAVCDQSEEHFSRKVERAVADLQAEAVITVNIAELIQQFAATAASNNCPYLGAEEIERLIATASTENGRFVHSNARQSLLFSRAQLADQRKDYDEAIAFLEQAMAIDPTVDAALLIAYFHVENGDLGRAVEYLEGVIEDPPTTSFLQREIWRKRLRELLDGLGQN